MSQTGQFLTDVTLGSGDSQTSDALKVANEETLTVQLVGDDNSTNIDLALLSRANSSVPVSGEYSTSIRNEDISKAENRSRMFVFDIADVSDVYVKINNNGSNSTDLDAYYAVE